MAHVNASTLSLLLLVIGVSGFVGTTLIGRFIKHGLYRTLAVIPARMAGIAVAKIPPRSFSGERAHEKRLLFPTPKSRPDRFNRARRLSCTPVLARG